GGDCNAFFSKGIQQPQKLASGKQVLYYVSLVKCFQFKLPRWGNSVPAQRLKGSKQQRSNAMLFREPEQCLPINAAAGQVSDVLRIGLGARTAQKKLKFARVHISQCFR